MSALPSRPVATAGLAPQQPKTSGFLHIVRHGAGAGAMYVVTYHRLDRGTQDPRVHPVLAEGAQSLIDLLDRMGVDFRLGEVRGALADILRFGSANIPDVWLSTEKSNPSALVET
jgi:hypothetical protein